MKVKSQILKWDAIVVMGMFMIAKIKSVKWLDTARLVLMNIDQVEFLLEIDVILLQNILFNFLMNLYEKNKIQ